MEPDDIPIVFLVKGLLLEAADLDDGCPNPLLNPALFEKILLENLYPNVHKLPLLNYCRNGGSPDYDDAPEIYDLAISKRRADKVSGTFRVVFTESYYEGCRENDFTEKQHVQFYFTVDTRDQKVTIEADENWPTRQCVPEEF